MEQFWRLLPLFSGCKSQPALMKKTKPSIEIYKATGAGRQKGRWRFRIKARNGRVLAISSEGYVERRKAARAVAALRKIFSK